MPTKDLALLYSPRVAGEKNFPIISGYRLLKKLSSRLDANNFEPKPKNSLKLLTEKANDGLQPEIDHKRIVESAAFTTKRTTSAQ